jgi:hypothetical protein
LIWKNKNLTRRVNFPAREKVCMKSSMKKTARPPVLYRRIQEILTAAQTGVARTVNTTQVVANWLIGREIVEEEQRGAKRAEYGARLMHEIAARLHKDYGAGYGLANLKLFRQFFLTYPDLAGLQKGYAARGQLEKSPEIPDPVPAEYPSAVALLASLFAIAMRDEMGRQAESQRHRAKNHGRQDHKKQGPLAGRFFTRRHEVAGPYSPEAKGSTWLNCANHCACVLIIGRFSDFSKTVMNKAKRFCAHCGRAISFAFINGQVRPIHDDGRPSVPSGGDRQRLLPFCGEIARNEEGDLG